MSVETTFIYGLRDPRDSQIRYVGKSNDPRHRLRGHLSRRGGTYARNWIGSLLSDGIRPELVILEEVSKKRWKVAEQAWIQYLRRLGCKLTNLAAGGGGPSGRTMPAAERAARKISAKKAWDTRRKKYGAAGVSNPEQFSRNASAAAKGRIPWNKGKKEIRSEVLANISQSAKGREPWNKGRKETRLDVLKRQSRAHKGKKLSAEQRRKIGSASKQSWRDPAYRKKMSVVRKRQWVAWRARKAVNQR